jgi:hypothetical protein
MEREYIREAHIIERYLQGKLSAEEEQAFEETYLADAEVLNELLLTERLRDGLKGVAGAAELRPAAAARGGGFFETPRYAAAASIVAAVSLLASGWLYVENRTLRTEPASLFAANTQVVPLFTVRGTAANVIDAPAADESIVLLLDPGFGEYDAYQARLVRRTGGDVSEISSVDELEPSYEGMLALTVSGRSLTPGEYEIELTGRGLAGRTEPVSRTAFTVSP